MVRRAWGCSYLSRREIQVVTGLADGLSYAGIGERLGIERETVHGHVRHAFRVLQVRSAGGAVGKALRDGWIE